MWSATVRLMWPGDFGHVSRLILLESCLVDVSEHVVANPVEPVQDKAGIVG